MAPRPASRAPRSDAAANRERILAAAAIAVREQGPKVPMAALAAQSGVGVGTLYRHFPTREVLIEALAHRSYRLVLDNARRAAGGDGPAIEAIGRFFEGTIRHRRELILPMHGGPVASDDQTLALRAEIREALSEVLARGQADGTIRADVSAADVIVAGAQLAEPLAHVADWDRVARRQARIMLAGLAAGAARA